MLALQRPTMVQMSRACPLSCLASSAHAMRHRNRRNPSLMMMMMRRRRKTVVMSTTSSSPSAPSSSDPASHHCSLKRTLLVAVDESAASKRAVLFALDHMYRPGDTVHLLHVISRVKSPAAPSGALYYAPPLSCSPEEAKGALEKNARAFIAREFAGLVADRALPPRALAVDVVHELDAGSHGVTSAGETVGEMIVRVAEELDAAALVLLSHHKKRLEELVWGSVSKEVASRTKRPVVLVH